MPREKVQIVPNWEVSGLLGTGSNDLVVTDVVVPEEWTFVRGGASSLDTPLYRYPTLALAAQVLSVVALGIARAAIDEVLGMAAGRASVTGAPNLGDRIYVQLEVAKIEAELRAARSWFYGAIDDAWQVLLAGDEPSDHQVSMLRLSTTHAARVGADVTRRAQMLTATPDAGPMLAGEASPDCESATGRERCRLSRLKGATATPRCPVSIPDTTDCSTGFCPARVTLSESGSTA